MRTIKIKLGNAPINSFGKMHSRFIHTVGFSGNIKNPLDLCIDIKLMGRQPARTRRQLTVCKRLYFVL
jgi:hypothetical protein